MGFHTPTQVAETVKDILKKNGIKINDFAKKQGVTPSQIYSVLDGKSFLPHKWAYILNEEFGIDMMYSVSGMLPIMDPRHDFNKLIDAVTDFVEILAIEDRLRDQLETMEKSMNEKELISYKEMLLDARRRRTKAYEPIDVFLRKEWDVDYENPIEKAELALSSYQMNLEESINENVAEKNQVKLHEAICKAISDAGRALTFKEITAAINDGHLYSRKDGKPVPASQISSRVQNYIHLFDIDDSTSPKTVNIKG